MMTTIPYDKLSLVVIQPTQFCNLDCKYCYLANRHIKSKLSDDVLDAIIDRLQDHNHLREKVIVLWHAGEPLAAGIDFYRKAFDKFSRLTNAVYTHSIQTNATLLTPDFCELFKAHNVTLGISFDGPRFLNDAQRVDRKGRGTYDRIMEKIDLLKSHNLPAGTIAVVTEKTLENVEEFIQFFAKIGMKKIALLFEEVEGHNLETSLADCDKEQALNFWRKTLTLSEKHGIEVREFTRMLKEIIGITNKNPQSELGCIITIANNGDYSTFAPEMLTMPTEEYGSFIIGNVFKNSFEEAFHSSHAQNIAKDIYAGEEMCRKSCSYYPVCYSQFPSNKYGEKGTFKTTETQLCRLFLQSRADACMEYLEKELKKAA